MDKPRAPILPDRIVDELCSVAEDAPELEKMVRKARNASEFLKALAHETRLVRSVQTLRPLSPKRHRKKS